ncbi:MAG TPA: YceI family protein [Polyangiaceae bacterium]|nr:YceI family protein [Polyangiaceae bacterium]
MFESLSARAPGRWWSAAALAFSIGGLPSFSAAAEGPASPGGTSFTARPDALLYARVYRNSSGVLSSFSHDHVIRAGAFTASIHFDASAPARCSATLRIAVKSLMVDEPSMRQRAGLSTPLDAADRKTVRQRMLGEDQLDAEHHPEIQVLLNGCVESATRGRYHADVSFTIRGKTVRRERAARITFSGNQLSTQGSLRLSHAAFGIQPYSAWLGSVGNAEPIDFVWALQADQVTESPAKP